MTQHRAEAAEQGVSRRKFLFLELNSDFLLRTLINSSGMMLEHRNNVFLFFRLSLKLGKGTASSYKYQTVY
jgi:hypothetical protein